MTSAIPFSTVFRKQARDHGTEPQQEGKAEWLVAVQRASGLMSTYGRCLLDEQPVAVSKWLSREAKRALPHAASAQDVTALQSYWAYVLACKLHAAMAGKRDPDSGGVAGDAVLGIDVATARVLADIGSSTTTDDNEDDEDIGARYRRVMAACPPTLLTKGSDLTTVMGDDEPVAVGAPDDNGTTAPLHLDNDIKDARQLVLPVLLGYTLPVSIRLCNELLPHVLASDDTSAMKIMSRMHAKDTLAATAAIRFPGHLTCSVLVRRLETVNAHFPALLYRALCAVGCAGPLTCTETPGERADVSSKADAGALSSSALRALAPIPLPARPDVFTAWALALQRTYEA